MKLVVFMPAYNEEESIGGVLDGISEVIKTKEVSQHFNEMEVVVLNDGSSDNTKQIAEEKGAIVHTITGKSSGVGRVLRKGTNFLLSRRPDVTVSIDADGQFDPKDIPRLIAPVLSGEADLVTGSKFTDKKNPPVGLKTTKLYGNYLVVAIVNKLLGSNFTDVSCGYRVYSKKALLNLNIWGDRTYVSESIMDLYYKELSIVEVPINAQYLNIRPSKVFRFGGGVLSYGVRTGLILLRAVRDYNAFSVFGRAGFYSSFIGLLCVIFLFVNYFITGSFSPYIFLGFIGGSMVIVGMLLVLMALIMDLNSRTKLNTERSNFYERWKLFYPDEDQI